MANEVRLVDANALIEDITAAEENAGMGAVVAGTLRRYVNRRPTIDPESLRPKGRWNRMDDPEFVMGDFECSVCEYLECDVDTRCLAPGVNCLYYCPNCGAKMEG